MGFSPRLPAASAAAHAPGAAPVPAPLTPRIRFTTHPWAEAHDCRNLPPYLPFFPHGSRSAIVRLNTGRPPGRWSQASAQK